MIENMAYMGIMAAINVLFVLITTLVPVLLFLIVFVLPLTSSIVTVFCKKKYFIIYAVATVMICMLITIWNVGDTLFYVLPSIISGFIFGLLLEKKISPIWSIIICALIQMGFSFLTLPLIKLITNVDLIKTFLAAFKLEEFAYPSVLTILFIFFLSLAQESLAYSVIKDEMPKFGYESNEDNFNEKLLVIVLVAISTLNIIFMFINKEASYLLLCLSIYFSIIEFANLLIKKDIKIYILLVIISVLFIFIFGLLYIKVPLPNGLSLICVYSFMVGIIGLINNYLLKRNVKDTII